MTTLALRAHRAVGAVLILASTSCLARNPAPPARVSAPLFDPTVFFAGRTHGEGILHVRAGSTRALQVEGVGRFTADGTFALDQTVTFASGVVETRTWRMRRLNAGHYAATLSDAKGEVQAEVRGNAFHLRYLIRQPAVYMEQWLYLAADGQSAANQAQVTVLGVPWARLAETITRRSTAGE